MNKIHTLFVIIMLGTFSMVYCAVPVPAYVPGHHYAVAVGNGILGMHLFVNGQFNGIALTMPTWSVNDKYSAFLSVYPWDESYKKTIAGKPLASRQFTHLKDNASNQFFFPELPAGEYFICIEKAVGQVGSWVVPGNTRSFGYMFKDGVEQPREMEMTVFFTENTTVPFSVVQSIADTYREVPAYKEITAGLTDYSAYQLPSDSLYWKNEVMPDTWVFTDGLGRHALTSREAGPPQKDKSVMIFYSTWHDSMSHAKPFNIQQFLDEQQAKGIDIRNIINDYDYDGWPKGNYQNFWNEPVYGYYSTADQWVLRRQAELLANAGVDAISTDNTNGTFTWETSYTAIYKTWQKAQKDGVKTPKVSYMLPFGPGANTNIQLESLYQDIYFEGKYLSLWFWWDGKPFILAHPQALGNNPLHKSIKSFFTYRNNYPGYINPKPGFHSWGWLSVYPQALYYDSPNAMLCHKPEETTVGVAQNHNWKLHELSAQNGPYNTGRSYTSKGYDSRADSLLYGANFAEQWEYALKANPRLVYVTGWNEWIAGRFKAWPPGSPAEVTNAFPDQFNDENSRDIEPTHGKLKDHYYYQLVNYVRRYKGVRNTPKASLSKTIDLSAAPSQWAEVAPYFAAYIGNTADRDRKGYTGYHYTDKSGRNDIIGTQMARDDNSIFILVECAKNITSYQDKLWMNIYLDTTPDSAGWESFDFVINKTTPQNDKIAYLERFTGNGFESKRVAEIPYNVNGRYLQLAIPKTALGITGNDFTIKYSVTDNVHDRADTGTRLANGKYIYTTFSGNILDFYTSGDVAPGGRFQYCYVSQEH